MRPTTTGPTPLAWSSRFQRPRSECSPSNERQFQTAIHTITAGRGHHPRPCRLMAAVMRQRRPRLNAAPPADSSRSPPAPLSTRGSPILHCERPKLVSDSLPPQELLKPPARVTSPLTAVPETGLSFFGDRCRWLCATTSRLRKLPGAPCRPRPVPSGCACATSPTPAVNSEQHSKPAG